MKRVLVILLILVPLSGLAQPWTVTGPIPEGLTKGSDAVVRYASSDFSYSSLTQASHKTVEVITVLNPDGEDTGNFRCLTNNNFSALRNFKGEVFDRNGKSVRMIKKSDLVESHASDGLADDYVTFYYSTKASGYPYTVVYEYEVAHNNGVFTPPTWLPAPSYRTAVQYSVYRLSYPESYTMYVYPTNLPGKAIYKTEKGRTTMEWEVRGLKGVEGIHFSPPVYPILRISPHSFTYNGKQGEMDSWDSYSKWQWSLMEGRNTLPQELRSRVKQLTAGAGSDREKAELLYNYLGETTRYVSIQIGLGGFQPMTIEEVYRNKFGDCKALSYYLQAMLAECGIDSYYTEIGHGSRRMEEYAHPTLTNHAILQLPLDGDTLWLECTNPKLVPFGYTHSDISARKALIYRDGTAEVVEIKGPPDSLNCSVLDAVIVLSPEGYMEGEASITNTMWMYEDSWGFDKLAPAERLKRVARNVNVPLSEISNISFSENRSAVPSSTLNYDLLARVNESGSRVFLTVNPFRKLPNYKLPRTRSEDIVIYEGYRIIDNITVRIPESMTVESLPDPVAVDNVFGSYSSSVTSAGDGLIMVSRRMQLRSGHYDAERYGELRAFFNGMEKENNAVVVLRKTL